MPWLHTPKATAETVKQFDFRFKKSFGQNFLIDSNIIDKIIDSAKIRSDDFILEIGPGIGTLTQHLAYHAGAVAAVEIDSRLIPVLEHTLSGYDNVAIINEDILKVDIQALLDEHGVQKPIKVIANLPYYVTTPVIMELLEKRIPIESITIMIQREVADRISAPAGTKNYGALSLAVNYFSTPCKIIDVSPNCFMPRPEVTSSVIQLCIKKERIPVADEAFMFKVIRAAFSQRRKTLINSLKNYGEFNLSKQQWEKILSACSIAPEIRGETLTLADFARLSDEISKTT